MSGKKLERAKLVVNGMTPKERSEFLMGLSIDWPPDIKSILDQMTLDGHASFLRSIIDEGWPEIFEDPSVQKLARKRQRAICEKLLTWRR